LSKIKVINLKYVTIHEKYMGLEDKIKSIGNSVSSYSWRGLEFAVDMYNQAYDRYPQTTKFLSTAVGTVGGDYIAKKIVEGEDITLRDIAFTTFAAMYQSYFYPKLIDCTEKIADVGFIKRAYQKLGISKEWAKTFIIGGLFFILGITLCKKSGRDYIKICCPSGKINRHRERTLLRCRLSCNKQTEKKILSSCLVCRRSSL